MCNYGLIKIDWLFSFKPPTKYCSSLRFLEIVFACQSTDYIDDTLTGSIGERITRQANAYQRRGGRHS